jgi:hypothetical protein
MKYIFPQEPINKKQKSKLLSQLLKKIYCGQASNRVKKELHDLINSFLINGHGKILHRITNGILGIAEPINLFNSDNASIEKTDPSLPTNRDSEVPIERVCLGINFIHERGLETKAQDAVNLTATTRSPCYALITFHSDEDQDEIRISFLNGENELIDGYVWPGFCNNENVLEKICAILLDACIDHIMLMEGVSPLTYSETTDEPCFFTLPAQEISPPSDSLALH